MNDCIFCKIINQEIPANIVYQDDKFLAFLDINPVAAGHTLLIPKAHYNSMAETPDRTVGEIYVKAKELMLVLKKGLNADFVVLSVVGMDVPHLHIHLIPRYNNDGLASFWPTKKYQPGEVEAVIKKIKNNL